jgi:beta-lactamase class A
MKQFLFLTLLISFCTASLHAQKTDKKLQRQLSEMFRGFNGTVGIYVKDLEKNKIAAVNADTIFPTASMVKIPILVGIMDKINKGELDYHQNID